MVTKKWGTKGQPGKQWEDELKLLIFCNLKIKKKFWDINILIVVLDSISINLFRVS